MLITYKIGRRSAKAIEKCHQASSWNHRAAEKYLPPEHQCSKAARKQRSSRICIRQSILGGFLEDRFELENGLVLLLLLLAV